MNTPLIDSSRCPISNGRRFFKLSCCLSTCLLAGIVFFSPQTHAIQLIDPPTIDAASSGTLKQLLVTDWERDPTNRSNSKNAFDAIQPASTGVTLAYLLNRMRHNEKREALDVADRFTRRQPETIDGWLIKAHLNALMDNFDRALVDLRSVKKQIDENKQLSEVQKVDIYRRMGRLTGYMQGPVQDRINPDILSSTMQFISEGANADQLAALNEANNEILQRFNNRLEAENTKTQQELEKIAAENATLDETLTQQNEQLERAGQELLAQQEQLKAEGNRRLADLTSQASPLQSNLASISSQINAVQYDLQLLYNDLFYAQNVPPEFRTSTWYLQDQIRGREVTLYNLQSSANSVNNQLGALQTEIALTQREFNSQIAQLQQQSKKQQRTLQRNQKQLAKIASGPEITAGKKESIESRLAALNSYIELPVELYRQQLLELVANK